MTDLSPGLRERFAAIKLLVLDVDGVLTDGRLYFTARGEEMKCFHVRDGSGIVQLLRSGVQVAVISGRNSEAVHRRMSELGVQQVHQGVNDKHSVLREVLATLRVDLNAVACMGDDLADVEIMQAARLAITVPDGHHSAASVAHFVTQQRGGEGAVREVCDLLLSTHDKGLSP